MSPRLTTLFVAVAGLALASCQEKEPLLKGSPAPQSSSITPVAPVASGTQVTPPGDQAAAPACPQITSPACPAPAGAGATSGAAAASRSTKASAARSEAALQRRGWRTRRSTAAPAAGAAGTHRAETSVEAQEFASTAHGYDAPGRPIPYDLLYGRTPERHASSAHDHHHHREFRERREPPGHGQERHGHHGRHGHADHERRDGSRDWTHDRRDYAERRSERREDSYSWEEYSERYARRFARPGEHHARPPADPCCRRAHGPRLAGVDHNGFLTWPGKVED